MVQIEVNCLGGVQARDVRGGGRGRHMAKEFFDVGEWVAPGGPGDVCVYQLHLEGHGKLSHEVCERCGHARD